MEASFISVSGPFFALLGAALVAGLGAIGSSYGVGIASQAATGLAAERPEMFGKALVLGAIPSSQAIYGMVGAFIIMGTVTDITTIDAMTGLALLAASLPLALGALYSGIFQGKVLAGGMNMLAKGEENMGKAIILGVMVETFALFGLLMTILMQSAIASSL